MLWRLFATSHIEDYLHGDAWAVVTGSTNGIGLATADVLLSKGFNVLIHGRNPTKLAKTLAKLKSDHPNRQIKSVIADFSNLKGVSKIPDFITSNNLRVTLFINKVASVDNQVLYLFRDLPNDVLDRTLIAGVTFFTKLCRLVVPLLEAVDGNTLMANIGSRAAKVPTPYMAVDSATKGYVFTFTRSLAIEARLTPSNVRYLYIDVQGVSTPNNIQQESLLVPSVQTFAESLVFSLGRRQNRNRGSDVLVTPYWAHEMARMMSAFIPGGMLENILVNLFGEMKELFEKNALKRD